LEGLGIGAKVLTRQVM